MRGIFLSRDFIWFLAKFFCFFALFYFGTSFVIGAASPGGFYSVFIDQYFDYISWMRHFLIQGVALFVNMLGYPTRYEDSFVISIENGRGVFVGCSCGGYGVISFLFAYVLAYF